MTVSTSNANMANPFVARPLRRLHRIVEYQDGRVRSTGFEHLEGQLAYVDRRADMVRQEAPGLSASEVATVAAATRGLAGEDVLAAAREYVHSGLLCETLDDPTNTCDPDTGSWMERLLPTPELADEISSSGYDVTVVPGWWGTSSDKKPRAVLRNAVKLAMNQTIAIGAGLSLAPAYCVVAEIASDVAK